MRHFKSESENTAPLPLGNIYKSMELISVAKVPLKFNIQHHFIPKLGNKLTGCKMVVCLKKYHVCEAN